MGDAIINKTYTVDCISKKKKRNNGERAKYYVENNHPAIIDRATFGKVQEEIARRSGLAFFVLVIFQLKIKIVL